MNAGARTAPLRPSTCGALASEALASILIPVNQSQPDFTWTVTDWTSTGVVIGVLLGLVLLLFFLFRKKD